jgi:hypothetical protein
VCSSFLRTLQGGAEWHRRKRAHRPGHAHAEVARVLVLALSSVPRERAALLGEEAATIHSRAQHRRLESRHRRRCVQERRKNAHCEERRRQSALEPISSQVPAAQRQFEPAEAGRLAVNSNRGRVGARAYRFVTAVSAEIVGGTLPEKRFSPRVLRRSVPIQHARGGWETARAAAQRTGRPAW